MKNTFHPPATLRQDLQPQKLLPILTVSQISGLVVTTYMVSFGTLIFSGDLSAYLPNGIGYLLMGVVLIGTIEALLSGTPGMVAIPTIASAVILAAMGANISQELGAAPEMIYPTVIVAIMLGSLLTGGAFLMLGWFRLGNLIRYIPFPVIGGFLAGTGWLVLSGALKTMNGIPLSIANLSGFVRPEALVRWVPGAIFGVALLLLVRRYKHYLITPIMILGGVLLFYLYILMVKSLVSKSASAYGVRVTTVTVNFTNNTTPGPGVARFVEQTNTPRTGICQACHDPAGQGSSGPTNYWRSNGTIETHNPTLLCTDCHFHEDNFKGAGDDCLVCHRNDSQSGTYTRRAVGPDFANTTAGGQPRSHHVGNAGTFMGGTLTNFDCVACHMEGYVDTTTNPDEVKSSDLYHGGNGGTRACASSRIEATRHSPGKGQRASRGPAGVGNRPGWAAPREAC